MNTWQLSNFGNHNLMIIRLGSIYQFKRVGYGYTHGYRAVPCPIHDLAGRVWVLLMGIKVFPYPPHTGMVPVGYKSMPSLIIDNFVTFATTSRPTQERPPISLTAFERYHQLVQDKASLWSWMTRWLLTRSWVRYKLTKARTYHSANDNPATAPGHTDEAKCIILEWKPGQDL